MIAALLLATAMLPIHAVRPQSTVDLPPLHVEGPNLKTPDGRTVILRGCNLGNWFMIEHWMWDQNQGPDSSHDQFELEALLTKRFGGAEKDRLMDLYRSSWITDRDLKIIRSFRFNCVRLPVNYRMFEDDASPFHLRPDAWRWTDKAVQMCRQNGLYVILDMHGVQGGQSTADHTGRQNQNKIWTSPEDQKRLAWLWGEVAAHYRDEPTIAAYDVINEPYGGEKPAIKAVFEQAYRSLREHDSEKLVYAMGHYSGFDFYGDPNANGWHNVGIEMHYYPGLFGDGSPTIRNSVRHLEWLKNGLAPEVKKLDVPFYIGEMNVVFTSSGGPGMMRRDYDFDESQGWSTTLWSYKVLGLAGGLGDGGSWAMVANRDPIPKIDFATAPESEIEGFFRSQATMPYTINRELQEVMAPEHVSLPPLPVEHFRTTAPQGELPDWTLSDIGGAMKGGLETHNGELTLYGGGADIWADRDQFRFLYKKQSADFVFTARVDGLENIGPYAKAGVMARESTDPASRFLMMSVFPSGDVQVAVRSADGKNVEGTQAISVGFPVELRIARHDGHWTCQYRHSELDKWSSAEVPADPGLGSPVLCGVVALSHDEAQLVKATYRGLSFEQGGK